MLFFFCLIEGCKFTERLQFFEYLNKSYIQFYILKFSFYTHLHIQQLKRNKYCSYWLEVCCVKTSITYNFTLGNSHLSYFKHLEKGKILSLGPIYNKSVSNLCCSIFYSSDFWVCII